MRKRVLADFTPLQQQFLLKACTQGVDPDDPICTPRRTKKLEDAGLIHKRQSKKGRVSWRTTDVGRGMVAAHVPRLLARRSQYGYTHQPHQAMRHEPEAA